MIKVESGMNFIVDEFTYIMEDDSFYNKISSKYQTKDVDFIIKRNSKLLFIEAKTSSPKVLDRYTNEIVTKFTDSLIIFIGIILDRKNTKSSIISKEMKNINHLKNSILFVLIIKNAKKEYLAPISNILNKKLRKINIMFSIESSVIVMNETQAISRRFVSV